METIAASEALRQLLGRSSVGGMTKTEQAKNIKKFGLKVVAEMPYGRGTLRLFDKAQFDEILAKHGPKPAVKSNGDFPSDDKASLAELHLGALETKVDRLCDQVKGLTDSMNVFIKSANLMTERLDKVLKSLE